jgi:serine/threonine-protein kinase
MTEPRPPEGLVAGKYRLTRLLGKGGMGTVWEGVHESLGTRVAVKFIDAEHASSDDIRQRFVNEAKAAARLRSKHVVQVHDQGVGEDGRPYIVMEFLVGEPLDRRLDRLGRLPPLETARVVLHVCRALAKAHESGIVHRDLKPENVFLVHDEDDGTDFAKVVDFGIAKFTDASSTGSSSTRTGAVLGTPQFMSPEQARGLRTVDHRTDLWSLGVIAYQCLVGALPFRGEAVGDLLVNICTADPPAPSSIEPDVPPGFDAWIRRALAREPADRFQSAAELADSLCSLLGLDAKLGPQSSASNEWMAPGPPPPDAVTAAGLSTTHVPSLGSRRSVWVALVVAVGLLVVAAGAIMGARSAAHAGPEPSASAVPAARAEPSSAPADVPVVTPVTERVADSAEPPKTAPPRASVEVGKSRGRVRGVPAAPGGPARSAGERPPAPKPRTTDELGY